MGDAGIKSAIQGSNVPNPDEAVPIFFSSSRRHTSYIGDWSSDVCSSDLPPGPHRNGAQAGRAAGRLAEDGPGRRAEERRVGKEGKKPRPVAFKVMYLLPITIL